MVYKLAYGISEITEPQRITMRTVIPEASNEELLLEISL